MTLLNSENLHKGRHVKPLAPRARDAFAAGRYAARDPAPRRARTACSARGVDPVQLYISIAGEGYFYLSNRYTLSRIFDRDLMAPRARWPPARGTTPT